LLQLQKEAPEKTIITMCDDMEASHCAPQPHISAKFNSDGVSALRQLLSARGVCLSAIYADYIHLSHAQTNVYACFFMQMMLPLLLADGIMRVDTQLFMPNVLPVREVGERIVRARESSDHKPSLLCTPIAAGEFPLFAAIQKMDERHLGADMHRTELGQLDPEHPFLRFDLGDSASSESDATQEQDATLSAGAEEDSKDTTQQAATVAAPPENLKEQTEEVSASILN
jgi:hypothetical protein